MAVADPLFTFVTFLLNQPADFNPPTDSSSNHAEIDLTGLVSYSHDNPINFHGGYADALWGLDGMNDFCLEMAMTFQTAGTLLQHTDPDAPALKVYIAGGALKVDLGASVAAFSTPVGVGDGAFHYLVLQRVAGETSFYHFTIVDFEFDSGGQVGAAVADANEYATNTGSFRLGADAAGANVGQFLLVSVRYTNGLQRFDGAPGVPGVPFGAYVAAVSGTVLGPDGTPVSYRVQLWDVQNVKFLDQAFSAVPFGGTYELHAPYYTNGGADDFAVVVKYTPDDPSTAPVYNDMIRRVSIPDPFA